MKSQLLWVDRKLIENIPHELWVKISYAWVCTCEGENVHERESQGVIILQGHAYVYITREWKAKGFLSFTYFPPFPLKNCIQPTWCRLLAVLYVMPI